METLRLAKWETRFFAWLIDFILLTAVLNLVLILLPDTLLIRRIWDLNHWGIFDLGVQSFLFFCYWTLLEGFGGQSVGKIALNLRVVDRAGGKADLSAAALQAFGKAFLLPLDCLIGWLAMPGTRLRLFNRLSETIVISVDYPAPEGVEYVKDGE